MPNTRISAGCAFSFDDRELYAFGGRNEFTVSGTTTIDTYTVDTDTWTNNPNTLPQPGWNLHCIANVYDESIICPGGIAQSSTNSVSIYRTQSESFINEVLLIAGISSYGIVNYEFVNNANDEASIVLISGGHDGGVNVYDYIQYMVLYNVPTLAPTMTPTAAPSHSPSQTPTNSPIASPTRNPTQDPTEMPTYIPTFSPTGPDRQGIAPEKVTQPFGTDPGSSASRVRLYCTVYLSIIVVLAFQ